MNSHNIPIPSHNPSPSAFFAAVVESCNDALITYDGNGVITSWNQAAVKLFGHAKTDAIGQPLDQLFTSSSEELLQQRERLCGGYPSAGPPVETLRHRRDGTVVEVSISVSPIRSDSEEIIGFSEIIREITGQNAIAPNILSIENERPLAVPDGRDRQPSEQNRGLPQNLLQESQEFQEILDSAIAGIIRLRLYPDLSIEYDYISPHCEDVFGYTVEALMADGGMWRSHVDPNDWNTIILPELHQVLGHRSNSTHRIEYCFHRKDGGVSWILSNFFVRWNEAGQCWLITAVDTDITGRKQSEAALAQSEAYNRSIINAIPDLLYVVAADGTYRQLIRPNSSVDAITIEAPIGRHIKQLLPEDVAERHIAAIERTMATGELQLYEQQIWVGDRLQDEEVRLIKSGEDEVLLMVRDIGDRKQLERDLRRSEAQNRAMLTAIPDLIYQVNQDGIYLSYFSDPAVVNFFPERNPVGHHLLDYSPESVLPFDTFIKLRNLQLKALSTALATQELQVYDQTFEVQGKSVWEEIRVIPCGADEVLFVIRNITHRKQAQQKQQIAEQRLQEAQRIARLGNWILDHQTGVLHWSDGLFRLFEQNPEEFTPSCEAFLQCMHPDDRDRVHQAFTAHVRDRSPYSLTHRIHLANGQVKYIHEQCETYYNSDGTPRMSHGTAQDITQRKQAELALHNLIEATAATTGHDFFPALVKHISQALEVTYAIVTKKVGDQLESLAFYAHGELQELFTYPIAATPCEQSIQYGECCIATQLQQIFPQDPDLVDMQAESYIGIAMHDRLGNVIGTLCVIDPKPITEMPRKKQILHVFAARAAVELERQCATQQLEQLNRSLESTVEQRTADLQEREAEIRSIIEAIPDLLLRVTRDGVCLNAMHSIYTPDETFLPVHYHLAEVLPPDLLQQQLVAIDQALTTKQLQVYEHQFPKGDRMAYEEVRICAIDSDETLLIIRDISDRKRAEATLRKSEATNRALIAAIPDFMARMTSAGVQKQVINVGTIHCLISGKKTEDLNDISIFDILPRPIAQERLNLIQRALQHQAVQRHEYSLESDEQIFYEEARVTPLWDSEVLVVVRDITERKQAEESLKELSSRLDLALKSANIGIWAWHLQTNTLIWDNRMCELYGVPLDQRPSVTVNNWLSALHPEDRPKLEQLVHRILTGDMDCEVEFNDAIFRTLPPDHRIRYIKSNAVVQCDAENNPQQMIGINYDITPQKEATVQLQKTNLELARATRLKDEFLANMSHELRTPLNAILGMTEAFQEGIFGDINVQQTRSLQTIERSSTHLLELINDILDVAKIESGHITVERTTVAVAPLCRSSLAFVQQQAIKKHIQIEVEIAANLPDLFIDERRIRQVLINLLNNAVKFTPNGGQITLEVGHYPAWQRQQIVVSDDPLSPSIPYGVVRIAIADTGIGIAPDDINLLFQPFVQIDSALNRQYAGTGLGLTLVKRLLELHDGRVSVSSDVGVGSCFTVELPCTIALPSPSRLMFQQGPRPVAASSPPSESALILLAEDNEANVFTISNYLLAKGYRLAIAKTGTEAIALAQKEIPALILMDIQMPEMNGIDAIKHIRGYTDLADVPIIALTALAMAGDRDRCLAAGANDYLSKPIKLKQLVTILEKILSQ